MKKIKTDDVWLAIRKLPDAAKFIPGTDCEISDNVSSQQKLYLHILH